MLTSALVPLDEFVSISAELDDLYYSSLGWLLPDAADYELVDGDLPEV